MIAFLRRSSICFTKIHEFMAHLDGSSFGWDILFIEVFGIRESNLVSFFMPKSCGKSKQTSCLSFSSNFLISAWMFLQASCSSTCLYLKSSLRYLRCWVLALIRLRVLETEISWRVVISLGSGFLRNLNLTSWPYIFVVFLITFH